MLEDIMGVEVVESRPGNRSGFKCSKNIKKKQGRLWPPLFVRHYFNGGYAIKLRLWVLKSLHQTQGELTELYLIKAEEVEKHTMAAPYLRRRLRKKYYGCHVDTIFSRLCFWF